MIAYTRFQLRSLTYAGLKLYRDEKSFCSWLREMPWSFLVKYTKTFFPASVHQCSTHQSSSFSFGGFQENKNVKRKEHSSILFNSSVIFFLFVNRISQLFASNKKRKMKSLNLFQLTFSKWNIEKQKESIPNLVNSSISFLQPIWKGRWLMNWPQVYLISISCVSALYKFLRPRWSL